MDTKKNVGLSKGTSAALLLQFILIVLACAATCFILVFSITHPVGPLFIIAYAAVLLSYAAVIFYAVCGYKKDDRYFLGAVYAFCAAIQLNVLLPFRTSFQLAALTILLCLYVAFAQRLKEPKSANWLLFGMAAAAAAFSVYSTATARTENLNELSENLFSVSAMYLSIWTPVIMTVTLALAYSVRIRRR